MKSVFTAIAAAILSFAPLSAAENRAGDFLQNNVVHKKLSNGINVLILNRGYSPTLAFDISFRVGSADESYSTAGAAHFLEHMLFKGTDKIGTTDYESEVKILRKIEALGETIDRLKKKNPENPLIPEMKEQLAALEKQAAKYVVSSHYDRIYSENGAVGFNASTSRDKTGYYIELPASGLELWARIESERLLSPVFREFYTERDNVFQERLMRYDSSGNGLLYEQFLATAFMSHSYRHPTIGWKTNTNNLTLKNVRGFFNKYYIPSRMTITVVGKQDPGKTLKIIEEYFGRIKPRPDPGALPVSEPAQSGERRFELRYNSNPYVVMGWHKPAYPSDFDYAFEVIAGVLGSGKTSRLYRSLVLEKKIASSVSVWNGSPGLRYDNLFVVFAAPAEGHSADEVEQAVYSEIARLKDDVSGEEIERVNNSIESQMVFSLASNKGLAGMLSYYQTVHGDWKYLISYPESVSRVDQADISKAVSRYLVKENRTVGTLVQTAAEVQAK